MRVADALGVARRLGVDRLDALLLVAHHLRQTRTWLLAHDDEELQPPVESALREDLQRRRDGMPLAYLLGRREFHGIELRVSPAVLVPRPETELVVDWSLACIAGIAAPRVLDLGTGSGAIAIALALARSDACVEATDIETAALQTAQANASCIGAAVAFELGSWWQAAIRTDYHLIVSNPPYIAEGDPHLPALSHEPRVALVSGADGLDALRKLAAGAPRHLRPGGWILLEHGFDQGSRVRALLHAAGLQDVATRQDLAGLDRCTGGRRSLRANDENRGTSFAV